MKMTPVVSIILTSYNYAQYIGSAIESILLQSFTDWELIIVDDGSVDESLKVCTEFQKVYPEKIRIIAFDKNMGLLHSIQTGIQEAQGEYVAFLETDDVWKKDFLKQNLEAIRKDNSIFTFTDVMLVGEPSRTKDRIEKHVNAHTRTLLPSVPMCISWIIFQNCVPTFSCAFVKRSEILKVDFNIEVNQHSLDHWIWSQLSLLGSFVYIPQKLIEWRIHNKSYSFRKSHLPVYQFSKNETAYARSLRNLLSKKYQKGSIAFEKYLDSAFSDKYKCYQVGLREQVSDLVEFHRPSTNKIWCTLILIKDWSWSVFAS